MLSTGTWDKDWKIASSNDHMLAIWVSGCFQLVSTFLWQAKGQIKKLKWFLQNPLIILVTMVHNALEDECFSAHARVCLASGREVHGHGFLSSRGRVIPVMRDLCSLSGDNKLQCTAGRRGDPTAAKLQVWSLQSIMCLTTSTRFFLYWNISAPTENVWVQKEDFEKS